jgi:phosphoenolpyruvate carboxykinase (ATP)
MIHLLAHVAAIHDNLSPVELLEHAVRRNEGKLGSDGQFCVLTGAHTGCAASDKFIVDRADTSGRLAWGAAGQPLAPDDFEGLKDLVMAHLGNKEVYIIDFVAGPARCRLVTELAWQALFARNMFKVADGDARPDLMIVAVPSCEAHPAENHTRSSTFVALDLAQGLCLIGGTGYAGEIKKSVFTFLSWALPFNDIMPVHASVSTNLAAAEPALFFGLSGTGKTTLSASDDRLLLGDDEHGWGPMGIFNFEAGCYAKAIRLSRTGEPDIWRACHRFGTVLENVDVAGDRSIDFNSPRFTENTRAAYPLSSLDNAFAPGVILTHPRSIVMLTCDAFGVLPSAARLSPDAAIYHFLSGYTAKVAGTERGVTEPTATFSACFGAPFMPHHPRVYAELLRRLIDGHSPRIYLVNTGWTRGAPGKGERMKLDYTRELVRGILAGELDSVPTKRLMPFNLDVPVGLPDEDPRSLWENPDAYDEAATKLAQLFVTNFQRFSGVSLAVADAGPRP